jgi:3-hydroxyisobutyrate dehydrogenase-like beta-hydroxyacid dehydrogenase
VLAAYGDPVLHLGPPGAGQLVKLVNNAVFAANIGVLVQALRTATRLGIRGDAVLTGLAHGSGASSALLGVAAAGSVDAFAATVGEFIGKDVAVVRDVAAELGVDLGLLAQAHGVLAELMAPEHRDQLVGARPTGTTPQ